MDRICKENEHDFDYNLQEYQNYKLIMELSDGIFHDFKNILTNISGLTQLSLIEAETKELKSNLRSIYAATSEFKEALIRYQDLMSGKLISEKKAVQLNDIIKKSIEMVSFKFTCNKIGDIRLVTSIHSNVKILCNSYELHQAFLNIVMNGIDAMENTGGTLSISIYNIDDFVCIGINDTGVGIEESNFKKIFIEQFTTKTQGSGLGLKIAKATIEEHGGSISIKSKKNRGTWVNIYLPIYKDEDD